MIMEKRGFIGPASIPRRLIAFIIDLLIIDFVILSPFNKFFQMIIPSGTLSEQIRFFQENPKISNPINLLLIVIGILVLFYFTIFEYKISQTPGKIITGLYVIPQKKVKFINYLLSNITFIPVFPFYLLWIIDPVYMIISPKNQRLMEKLNNLLVVQKYKY